MSIKQLVKFKEQQNRLQAAWYRSILTIAAGGFALLAGLGPAIPIGVGKYFLAGTWLFLGIGIIAGAVATYLEVNLAKNLVKKYHAELMKNLKEQGSLIINDVVVANPSRILSWSKPLMVISLLFAVVCLVAYSIETTLMRPPFVKG